MRYFELKCTTYIKQNIKFIDSFEVIAKYISFSMAQDEKLKALHVESGFKHYNFSNFFPIERDGTYKQGSIHTITIRSLDESFIDSLSKTLRQNIDNPNFSIAQIEKKTIKQFFISELYSATPVIVTMKDGKGWVKEDDLMILHKQLQDNLEKKYQDFYGEDIKASQSFIQLFELKNHRLQSIKTTKNNNAIKFYGNKFRIVPNEDEVSQKLAFLALADGLGEKNSFGGGFCLGKGIRI